MKELVQVRVYGSRRQLHDLVLDAKLKPERQGRMLFFRLSHILKLARRVSELEALLEEMHVRINEVLGGEKTEQRSHQ